MKKILMALALVAGCDTESEPNRTFGGPGPTSMPSGMDEPAPTVPGKTCDEYVECFESESEYTDDPVRACGVGFGAGYDLAIEAWNECSEIYDDNGTREDCFAEGCTP